jgi:hypothetical protein
MAVIFRNIPVDEGTYWHMKCWTGIEVTDRMFGEWLQNNYPRVSAVNRFNSGDPYWILKGDNSKDQTHILLKWSSS